LGSLLSRARVLSPFVVLTVELVACASTVDVAEPTVPKARSRIIVGEPAPFGAGTSSIARIRRMSALGDDVVGAPRGIALAEGERVTLFYYPMPLADYFIPNGQLELVTDQRPHVRIPPSTAVYEGELRGGSLIFKQVTDLDPVLADIQFAKLDRFECLARGCYEARAGGSIDDALCDEQCSAPSVPEPAPPDPVARDGLPPSLGAGCLGCDSLAELPEVSCPIGQAQLFGSSGCAPIGNACPASGFGAAPSDIAPECIFYVVAPAGAPEVTCPPMRCGSMTSPCESVAQARNCGEDCPDGFAMLLGAGDYPAAGTVLYNARIIGACPALTTVRGDVWARFGQNALEDVRFVAGSPQGARISGSIANDGAGLSIRGVVVDGEGVAIQTAIHLAGGTSTISEVVVKGASVGLFADTAARAHLRSAVFESVAGAGLVLSGGGTRARIEDLAVRKTASFGSATVGLTVSGGAEVVVAGAAIVGMQAQGARIAGAGSSMQGAMFAVYATDAEPIPSTAGIEVDAGGSLILDHAMVKDLWSPGILVSGAGATATLTAATIEGSPMGFDRRAGVVIGEHASVDLEKVKLSGRFVRALAVGGEGAKAKLADLEVEGTGTSTACTQVALSAMDFASLEVSRAVVAGPECYGLVADSSASVSLSQVRLESSADLVQVGASIGGGATVVLDRCAIQRRGSPVIDVTGRRTSVHFKDVRICGTEIQGAQGLRVEGGARLVAERFAVDDDILIMSPSTTATLTSLVVEATSELNCSRTTEEHGHTFFAEGGAFAGFHRAKLIATTLEVAGDGTRVLVEDLTSANLKGLSRPALAVKNGSHARILGARITGADPTALLVANPDTTRGPATVDAERLAVQGDADVNDGVGIMALDDAKIAISIFQISQDPPGLLAPGRTTIGIELGAATDVTLRRGGLFRNQTSIAIDAAVYPLSNLLDGVKIDQTGCRIHLAGSDCTVP
jgi:hypothetical protein